MFNPNYIYCLVYLSVIALYQLEWSDLYPTLSAPLLWFLSISILINFIFGSFISKLKLARPNRILENHKCKYTKIVTLCLLGLWAIDKYFGDIPTVHIILITFTSFYGIYVFSRFLMEKRLYLLIIYITLFLTIALLAGFRILIFFNLITALLTYIYVKNPFKTFKGKLIITSVAVGVFFVFGYLGNNLKGSEYNDGELILTIGEANDNFRSSVIPKEFFWTYLYASSPLANFELNVSHEYSEEPSLRGFELWVSSEFFPDFISKKVLERFDEKRMEGMQVNDVLNVSTVYMRSFRYFSWFGISIMALYIAVFPIAYLYVIRNSIFFIPGLVSIITIYMFLVFDNLFAFSALSFQLVYPIIGIISLVDSKSKNRIVLAPCEVE